MSTETLPVWFWILYYLFFIVTLAAIVFCLAKKRMIGLTVASLLVTITLPVILFINCIGRTEGFNEGEYVLAELQRGAVWAVYTVLGFLFLAVWWYLLLTRRQTANKKIMMT
ncbi:hypothetical protein FZC66_05900 [Priestia megaterium]|nr:hypothetical protein FZC66_05900 [Priestia megaterium]